jgi:hypothetical protein
VGYAIHTADQALPCLNGWMFSEGDAAEGNRVGLLQGQESILLKWLPDRIDQDGSQLLTAGHRGKALW